MTYQKRLSASKRTPLERKGTKYIAVQSPGPHKKEESMSLVVVIRDILKLSETTREAKKILNAKKVMVDGIPRKDHRFPIGFLDEISFTGIEDRYIGVYNKVGKLEFKKITKTLPKPMMITGKKILQKGKIQVNLFKGMNILLDKKAEYKVGDSLIIEKNKVIKHLKFQKGANVFLIAGKHTGQNGVIENIKEQKDWTQPTMITVKTKAGVYDTPKEYAYVTDGEL
ncbi:MAG: S4 domain-containing protein [Nanoarchaeota archaeon]|nr:S4 domain-containing protein [Nanoarchaeota archaeon]